MMRRIIGTVIVVFGMFAHSARAAQAPSQGRLEVAPTTTLGVASKSGGMAARDLVFTNGNVRLAGTLFVPPGLGPFPAVVLMHGAGPETRRPYVPDARMLVSRGIAAFIFDKRGTGESEGDWRRASLDDLMEDGLAAVALLRLQPEIAPGKVGLMGSSQGAWLAPFMAARSESVAFLVQITGSATPLANQEMWDDGNSLHALGFSDRAIETEMKALHLLFSTREWVRRGLLPLGDLWFVHYDPFLDPATAWPHVRVPALVLFGEKDKTVPTQSSIEILERLWARNGHPASRIVVFPGRGHALGGPSRNDDPVYAALVTQWIKAVTEGREPPTIPFPDHLASSPGLHWYGMGARTTPWYATASFQLPLMLMFALSFVGAAMASVLPWTKMGGCLSRWLVGVTGLHNALLLASLLWVINYLLNADATDAVPAIPHVGILLPMAWAAVALAVGQAWLWWKTRASASNRLGRLAVSLSTLASWAFVPFLAYWGVLGGRW